MAMVGENSTRDPFLTIVEEPGHNSEFISSAVSGNFGFLHYFDCFHMIF